MFSCSADGCDEPIRCKGYCKSHYQRLREYGRLDKIKTGIKTKHPLYMMWNGAIQRQALANEWKDFEKFLKDVGEKPLDTYLARIDDTKLCGPDNFYWKPFTKRLENETDKERRARRSKQKGLSDPTFFRSNNYRYVFGITLEQYNEMLAKQNGVCAICGNTETATYKSTGKIRNLAIDHCHKTKAIRKLLCSRCNLLLGRVNDDINLLEKIILYLKEHNDRNGTIIC